MAYRRIGWDWNICLLCGTNGFLLFQNPCNPFMVGVIGDYKG